MADSPSPEEQALAGARERERKRAQSVEANALASAKVAPSSPSANEKALTSANDILKLVTSLATGALVFGISLTTAGSSVFPTWLKVVLTVTWALLFFAVAAGIYSQSLIPLQLRKDAPNINAGELRKSAMTLEVLFVFGLFGLALTLSISLLLPPTAYVKIRSAADAVSAAQAALGKGQITKVAAVELVKGADANEVSAATWHVEFELPETGGRAAKGPAFADYYVNAVDGSVPPAAESAARADVPGRYTADGGVSAFYTWSGGLGSSPGSMLRHEALEQYLQLDAASRSERILYLSTDGVSGGKTPVSGSVYLPKGTRPAHGWPVVAWAHGTVGVADPCAPSWRGWLGRDKAYLNAWLQNGFAVVASDYQGLGTPGMHPYLLWKPEAYGILDATRAAIATFGLDNSVVIVGQSQGSGAALGARYLAGNYAPNLHVRATVVTGLVVHLAKPVPGAPQVREPNYAGGGPYNAVYSMLYLLGTDQAALPTLNVDDYVAPQGAPLLHTALSSCFTQLVQTATEQHLDPNSAFTPARQKLLATETTLGAFPTALLAGPIFTGTGLADSEAGTAAQYNFISNMCVAGTNVSWHYYPGLTHNGAVNASLRDSVPFTHAALAGVGIPSNCSTLVPPGPIQSPQPGVPHNT